jgi:hypothetical protein
VANFESVWMQQVFQTDRLKLVLAIRPHTSSLKACQLSKGTFHPPSKSGMGCEGFFSHKFSRQLLRSIPRTRRKMLSPPQPAVNRRQGWIPPQCLPRIPVCCRPLSIVGGAKSPLPPLDAGMVHEPHLILWRYVHGHCVPVMARAPAQQGQYA